MKPLYFNVKLQAVVTNLEDNSVVLTHDLSFNGRAPAIHSAVANMGKDFIHGLSISLPDEVTKLIDKDKKS